MYPVQYITGKDNDNCNIGYNYNVYPEQYMTGKEGLRIETRIIRGGAGNKNDKPNSQKFITSDIAL